MDWLANHCSCPRRGEAAAVFQVRDLNFAATGATAAMMRCGACGSLFPERFPTPQSVGEAYANYYTARPPRGGWRAWLRGAADRARRDYLARHTPKAAARLLDYGCGAGDFLAAMQARRPTCDAFGTDVMAPAGPPAFSWIDLDEIAAAPPFDWITLGHVLEHLDAPAATLEQLAGRLAPGGGLWIATPNATSFLFAAAGRWTRDVDFPRHREIFSRQGLQCLVEAAGLEARFEAAPRVNAALNALSTLRNILGDTTTGRRERGRAAWAVVLGLAIHCLAPRGRRAASSPEIIAVCKVPEDV